jgi:hypothetical protein
LRYGPKGVPNGNLRKMEKLRTFLAAAIIVFIVGGLALWQIPKFQVAPLKNAKGVDAKDVFKAENDARATLAQIFGGFAVLIGLGFAWYNITATAENLELTKEGQITERFTRSLTA